jgi:apolipoprotein N-acyltransferase
VVVAGTTGISAVIAPDGHEVARTQFFTPAYLDVAVRLKTSETPATRWGPLVQWVLVGAAIAVLIAAMLHNGWFVRPFRRRKRERGARSMSGGGDDRDNPLEQGESSSALAGQHDKGEP